MTEELLSRIDALEYEIADLRRQVEPRPAVTAPPNPPPARSRRSTSRGCICRRDARRWGADGVCATCRQHVFEAQLTPVVLQVLCAPGSGLVLWRNARGYDADRKIRYGIGDGGADYLGLYGGQQEVAALAALRRILERIGGVPELCSDVELIGSALTRWLAPAGRFVGVELKTARGRQQDNQRTFEALVTRLGGVYALVRGVDDARALLERLRSEPSR